MIVPKIIGGESISKVIGKLGKGKKSLRGNEITRLKNIREFMHPSGK